VKDFFFITNPTTQQQLLASVKDFVEEEISKLQLTSQHQKEEEELASGSVCFPTTIGGHGCNLLIFLQHWLAGYPPQQ